MNPVSHIPDECPDCWEEGGNGVLFTLSESLILFCTVATGGMKWLGCGREVSESPRAEEDAEPGCPVRGASAPGAWLL